MNLIVSEAFSLTNSRLFVRTLSLVLALAAGLFLATQPLDLITAALTTMVLGLLSIITPVAGLVSVVVLAPLRTLMTTEAPGQLPLDIGQIGLASLVLFYIFHRITQRQPLADMQLSPISGLLLVFIVVTGLTGLNAPSVAAWFTEWLKWVEMYLLVVLAMTLAKANRWQWLIFGLILSGVVNALIGLYEFFGGSGALHLVINERFFRAFGTFGQPNPFGGFMGLLLPLSLMAAVGYGLLVWQRWRVSTNLSYWTLLSALFYTLASAILLAGLVASWSRGAWLGFAVAIVVLALAIPRRLWQSIGLLISVAALIGVLWFSGLLPPSIVSRVGSITQEYFSFDDVRGVEITSENYPVVERLAHWQAALNIASAHPWFGIGFGNYEIAYDSYRLINWHFPLGHAHNYYLNILAEAGIIGLLAYGKVWIGIIVVNWKARRHPDRLSRFIAAGLLGSWAYLAVHSIFDNLYVNNLFLHLGLMLGVLAVLYNQAWKHHKVEI